MKKGVCILDISVTEKGVLCVFMILAFCFILFRSKRKRGGAKEKKKRKIKAM